MMIEQFIERLEQQGLLDKEVVDDLRRKVARVKGKRITPEAIAKYLVDKGHLLAVGRPEGSIPESRTQRGDLFFFSGAVCFTKC